MTNDAQPEPPPFQPLSARLAGRPVDQVLHEGVPPHMDAAVRDWLRRALQRPGLARRVALRLRIAVRTGPPAREAHWLISDLTSRTKSQLLEVVDAALYFHPAWDGDPTDGWSPGVYDVLVAEVLDLVDILEDGGSAYRIDTEERRLVRRVPEAVQAAVDQVLGAAAAPAVDNLRTAWVEAYGLHPDPDDAYDHAIKAVEAAACPLVLPTDPGPTLGKVIACLDQGKAKWRLVLVDQADQGHIEPLVVLMRRLWQGHRSRHGAGPTARPQTQLEAEAAVHLAVLLVQWLTAGVLTRITA